MTRPRPSRGTAPSQSPSLRGGLGVDRDLEGEEASALDATPVPADLRLLLPALVGWALVAFALAWPLGGVVAAGVVGAVVVLTAVVTGRRQEELRGEPSAWLRPMALTGAVLVLLSVCLSAWTAVREAGPVRELASERAAVTVEGRVASDPVLVAPKAGSRGGPPLVVLTLDVERVTGRGLVTSVHSPVLVLGDQRLLALRWQERIAVPGRLAPTDDPADDVVAILTPTREASVTEVPGLAPRLAESVRARFREAVVHLPADARGLMPGLVIGDTSQTPPDLTAAMLATGMTHLSAVSGSNVTFILAAGLGLCRVAGVRRRWRPAFALAVLGGFVVLVRPEPSVVRAAAMGVVGLLGLSASRRRVGLPALAAAVIVLLGWDPWLARSFGFVLSTLATLGLLLFAAPWGAAISQRLPARIRSWGPALAIPVAAQVVCAPVIVLLQSSVSTIGVVANLLAAPLVAPATVLGVAVALLAVVWTTGASVLAWLPALPTLGIAWIARTCSAVPWGTVPWPGGAGGAVILAVLSLAVLLAGPWLVHQSRRRPLAAVGAAILGLAVATPTSLVTWPPAGWQFVMCDVGQGDGMVLRGATGDIVVVDVGPDPALIDGCLSRLRVSRVDTVVLTHDHADHVDGLPGALRGRTVGQILASPVHDPPEQAREVEGWAAQAHVPLTELHAGDDLAWPGITAQAWWPARVIHAGSVPNNASIVLIVDIGGLRLAMLGDVEREAAHAVLLALEGSPSATASGFDVLKVAHHGSSNRDDALYRLIDAPVAVISVGVDNDYGHPAASTLEELQQQGSRVLRTDQSGDIAVSKSIDGVISIATLR
ncbi:MAG: ComEC/Rec2 family competence protein [Lapillicoccus sp.]